MSLTYVKQSVLCLFELIITIEAVQRRTHLITYLLIDNGVCREASGTGIGSAKYAADFYKI